MLVLNGKTAYRTNYFNKWRSGIAPYRTICQIIYYDEKFSRYISGENLSIKQILDKVYERYIKEKPTTGKIPTGYLGDIFNPITLRGDSESKNKSGQGTTGQSFSSVGIKTAKKTRYKGHLVKV